MVHQRVLSLVDDLDGGAADETVRFNLDGEDYEIDLSIRNAALLRQTLAEFVAVARRTGHTSGHRRLPPDWIHRRGDQEQNRAIRAWARRQGRYLRDRGRIPLDIVHAYYQSEHRRTIVIPAQRDG